MVTKIGILFLGRERPGFDPLWGTEMKKHIQEAISSLHYDYIIPSDNISNPLDLINAIEICKKEEVNVLIVTQPTISDGRLAPILNQRWKEPLVLFATPEKENTQKISSNSMVGTHVFAANLAQYNHTFEYIFGDPRLPAIKTMLDQAIKIIHTISYLRKAILLYIGYHAPGFIDFHSDPFLLDKIFSTQIFHKSIYDFQLDMKSNKERSISYNSILPTNFNFNVTKDINNEVLKVQSQYYLTLRDYFSTFHGISLRCWPELPNIYGQWPYFAISRLESESKSVTIEGDVDALLLSIISVQLGFNSPYLSDWLSHSENTVTAWHTGMIPFHFCPQNDNELLPKITGHFNDGKPCVVDSTIKENIDVTLVRLWHINGKFFITILEGSTTNNHEKRNGTFATILFTNQDINEWFKNRIHLGMPHHVSIIEGHCKKVLIRFFQHFNVTIV